MYGPDPYNLVLVHGGPGASGYLSPLAYLLSKETGLVEALQTKSSIPELIRELHEIVRSETLEPTVLLGHSWGAWLTILYAGRYPDSVRKLILVSSPPFQEKYTLGIMQTRQDRLGRERSSELMRLMREIDNIPSGQRDSIFLEIARILRDADCFEPDRDAPPGKDFSYEQYRSIWTEAGQLRSSGYLLKKVSMVKCPVTAIHGDHDPHPPEGVREPLEEKLPEFRFILLERCGHEPWSEKHARQRFLEIVLQECREA